MPVQRSLLVTGSNGLVGSAVVRHFAELGWLVVGADNNGRADFFGPEGDTRWNQRQLESTLPSFTHTEIDLRDRAGIDALVARVRPHAIVHAAAQPSHDLAARRPFDDFEVNAVGTLNLLEAARRYVPESPFVFMSTNKVYGDAPNEVPLRELETRWDYADPNYLGIDESMRVDRTKHSLFGASKLAADALVQEYGRYFGMPTCCLRAGCLTGAAHSGVELHGFLSYVVKATLSGTLYRIYGYGGKQVRDNLHASDLARLMEEIIAAPRSGEVYNVGGGRANACSVHEAFLAAESLSGRKAETRYVDEARSGDHICYISDLTKVRSHYPRWSPQVGLPAIFEELVTGWRERQPSP